MSEGRINREQKVAIVVLGFNCLRCLSCLFKNVIAAEAKLPQDPV